MKHLFFPAVILFMVSGIANAADEKLGLDHFKCYEVDSQGTQGWAAELKDQFHEKPQEVKVGPAVGLCNPAIKYHAGNYYEIQNKYDHLVVYPIYPQTGRPLRVLIRNQFGIQRLKVYQSVALMVPSLKRIVDDQTEFSGLRDYNLDHFQCYQARGSETFQRVGLIDQFDAIFQTAQDQFTWYAVWEPYLFCNPVEKTRLLEGETSPEVTKIINPDGHLTCYRIFNGEQPVDDRIKVLITNQFESETPLIVGDTTALCVPTQKIYWKPIVFTPIPFPFPPLTTP